ncbi:hypothetical protein J6590_014455 [Homalodisca vitripennis]|nr:hypothetical protein J6590_014455 [Homalodisca vitripennis]
MDYTSRYIVKKHRSGYITITFETLNERNSIVKSLPCRDHTKNRRHDNGRRGLYRTIVCYSIGTKATLVESLPCRDHNKKLMTRLWEMGSISYDCLLFYSDGKIQEKLYII